MPLFATILRVHEFSLQYIAVTLSIHFRQPDFFGESGSVLCDALRNATELQGKREDVPVFLTLPLLRFRKAFVYGARLAMRRSQPGVSWVWYILFCFSVCNKAGHRPSIYLPSRDETNTRQKQKTLKLGRSGG